MNNLTDCKISKETGISNGLLGKVRAGKSNLGKASIEKILEKYPNLNRDWLLTGEGPMYKDAAQNPTAQAASANLTGRARTRTIPYYKDWPVIASGNFQFSDLPATPEYIQLQDINGAEAAFPVIGCSMEPTIHEGEIIGVCRVYDGDSIDPERIYLIVTTDQQRMIKHIVRYDRENNTLTLTSDNKDYPPFDIPASFVTAIFRVCFHIVFKTC